MTKRFLDYVKELVPEKGEVFFTIKNHERYNGISLYQLADLLQGKKITSEYGPFNHITGVSGYSWNVKKIFKYDFDTIGLFLEFDNYKDLWIHFSKDAFIGAICIVASQQDITFDDEEHEEIRQVWARKINGTETEEDKRITEKNQSNFNEDWFYEKNKKSNPDKKK